MRHGDLRARTSRRSSDGSSHYLGTETSRPPPRRVSRDGPCAGLSEGQVPSVTKPAPFVTDDARPRRWDGYVSDSDARRQPVALIYRALVLDYGFPRFRRIGDVAHRLVAHRHDLHRPAADVAGFDRQIGFAHRRSVVRQG